MNNIQTIIEEAAKREIERQERQIINAYTTAGQITPQGLNKAIKEMQTSAEYMKAAQQQALIITNAATAAVVRKQFSRKEVEIIINNAADAGTVYVITDDLLKQQLLEKIDKRGF